ncbi:DNA gyrase subunit B [Streptomyces badius]
MAFLNKGLTLKLTDERESAKATAGADSAEATEVPEEEATRSVTYHYENGIVDFVKYLNSRKGEVIHQSVIDIEAEDRDRLLWPRSPCSGTRSTPRASTFSPTRSTRTRAARTRRASARR